MRSPSVVVYSDFLSIPIAVTSIKYRDLENWYLRVGETRASKKCSYYMDRRLLRVVDETVNPSIVEKIR